jgi:Fe-S cluster assembly iron-binding protein IscA
VVHREKWLDLMVLVNKNTSHIRIRIKVEGTSGLQYEGRIGIISKVVTKFEEDKSYDC